MNSDIKEWLQTHRFTDTLTGSLLELLETSKKFLFLIKLYEFTTGINNLFNKICQFLQTQLNRNCKYDSTETIDPDENLNDVLSMTKLTRIQRFFFDF